jgi:hypothetical protein
MEPKKEQKPAVEYAARADSPLVNGDVKMTISDNALCVSALFDAVEIAFAEINALNIADYTVTISADSGDYTLSRMGNWCQPFYDALCDAYNSAVLRSLFIKGNPILTAKGDYSFTENGANGSGSAPVHVYEDNVTTLPPDLSARRVPLCAVTAIDRDDYELTLRLGTGESYTYARLGFDTATFADAVEKQIRKLREASLSAVKEIDPKLTTAQASWLAKLLPHGAAAPIGRLAEIAPSFMAALEEKLAKTRAAESYTAFKELCGAAKIWMGFRKNEAAVGAESGLLGGKAGGLGGMLDGPTGGSNPLEALSGLSGLNGLSGLTGGKADGITATPDPYLLWLIAPSPDGQYAAVEFAEADSATFVYRTGGDFGGFAIQINRALEAINFKREVIRLSDEELRKPENADYRVAAKRTAALQFVRSNFAGRVIHSGVEAWKRKLMEMWGARVSG